MSDEIKEILESSRKIIKSNRENGFDRIIMLGDDIDKLLDYITNLQEENKTLKELNICVGCNYNPDYKSRTNKAIEFIEQYNVYFDDDLTGKSKGTYIPKELLNILKGSDK